MATLEAGFNSNLIDAFSTEYVLEDIEPAFQLYLQDATAVPGSVAEDNYFKTFASTRYIWMKDELNRNFFRFLRAQKLKRPGLRICGLDVGPARDPVVRQARFERLPTVLLEFMRQVFKRDVPAMVAEVDQSYDREALMALRASTCIAGSRRSMLHVGYFHAWSLSYRGRELPQDAHWRTLTHYLSILEPGKRIVTIASAQPVGPPNVPLEPLQAAFARADLLLNQPSSPVLTFAAHLPARIKQVLQVEDASSGGKVAIWPVWDYLIFGPRGSYAPLAD